VTSWRLRLETARLDRSRSSCSRSLARCERGNSWPVHSQRDLVRHSLARADLVRRIGIRRVLAITRLPSRRCAVVKGNTQRECRPAERMISVEAGTGFRHPASRAPPSSGSGRPTRRSSPPRRFRTDYGLAAGTPRPGASASCSILGRTARSRRTESSGSVRRKDAEQFVGLRPGTNGVAIRSTLHNVAVVCSGSAGAKPEVSVWKFTLADTGGGGRTARPGVMTATNPAQISGPAANDWSADPSLTGGVRGRCMRRISAAESCTRSGCID
jgi:hypothetical protein